MQRTDSYIRMQATICAVINMIVNPLLSWLGNRELQPTPLGGVVIDTAITCLIMSTAITFFTETGVRKALAVGQIEGDGDARRAGLLARLPDSWWGLGLALGVGFALVLVPLVAGSLAVLGRSALSFGELAAFKVVYTGALAYVATRWVIVHRLQAMRFR